MKSIQLKKLLQKTIYYRSIEGISKEIWLLSLVMLINRSGAMVIPFLTIYLNQELNISLGKCAIIMACFGVGSVLGAFVGGVLTDKIGFFRVMHTSLLASAVMFLVLMKMEAYHYICLAIFCLAFVYDTFRPANFTAIETFSKKENLTRSLGLVRLAVNLGYCFGPVIGGVVAEFLGYDILFILNALTISAAGTTFYFLFRNKQRKTTTIRLSKQESQALKMPWKDRQYLLFLFFFILTIIAFMQILYTAPLFYKTELGFSESMVGIFMAINGIMIVIVEMPLLFSIEKRIKPVINVVIGSFLMGLAYLTFIIAPTPLIAVLLYTLFLTMGEILSFPFSNNYAMGFTNDHNRGKYMGLYTMTFSTSHIIAPLIGLYMLEHFGFDKLWAGAFTICVLSAAMIFLTRKKEAVP